MNDGAAPLTDHRPEHFPVLIGVNEQLVAERKQALGVSAFVLGAALLIVPAALLRWFRSTGRRLALVSYLLVNLWVVIGFGLVKGLWESTLRVFLGTLLSSISTSFSKPTFGPPGLEISGIAIFIGSLFVLYYTHLLMQATFEPANPTPRRSAFVAAVSLAVSGPDPAKAAGVIQEVISNDKVQAIGGGVSLIGQVTKRYATEARIAHICVCTVMSIADGAYSFTNIPSPQAEGTLWVHEAQKRGIRRVALLTQDYPSINYELRLAEEKSGKAIRKLPTLKHHEAGRAST